jgi:hypothetical protein
MGFNFSNPRLKNDYIALQCWKKAIISDPIALTLLLFLCFVRVFSNSYFDQDAEESDTDSSYFDEDSEELDALLDLDEDYEEDDEATNSLTFSDAAEAGCCSASSNEVASCFPSENPGKRKRNADEDGEVEEEFMSDVHCQSKADRIEKRLKALSSMLGSELRSKEAIFDQTIHVVQSLQKCVSTNLQKA